MARNRCSNRLRIDAYLRFLCFWLDPKRDFGRTFSATALQVYQQQLETVCRQSPVCQQLLARPGQAFDNGRQVAAWLGIVPRQESSGGKPGLLGISKRGDTYLRTLLIHGARAVVRAAARKDDAHSRWINALVQRRNANIAATAANSA